MRESGISVTLPVGLMNFPLRARVVMKPFRLILIRGATVRLRKGRLPSRCGILHHLRERFPTV